MASKLVAMLLLVYAANAVSVADASTNSPMKTDMIEHIVKLITEIRTKVAHEGEVEAKSYDKFACFCKDKTEEKTSAIKDGEDEKEELEGNILDLQEQRDDLDKKIEKLVEKIKEAEEALEKATKKRLKEVKVYETNAADLDGAIEGLEGAIAAMEASKPSLVQMRSAKSSLEKAALMADALGISGPGSARVLSFLEEGTAVQKPNYEFHSGDIIDTLKGLLKDFESKRTEVEEAEEKKKTKYDEYKAEKEELIEKETAKMEEAKEKRGKVMEEISDSSTQLTSVASDLMNNKAYLAELLNMCHMKAKTWDQRTKIRAEELSGLTEAIKLIDGAIKKSTEKDSFMQGDSDIRNVALVAESQPALEQIEAAAEEQEAPDSFLQLRRTKPVVSLLARDSEKTRQPESGADAGRRIVVELLRAQGSKLKSTLLTSLSVKVAHDPLAKVKKLIQELIERLLQEASEEANQKGWCDKSLGDAEQKRDIAADRIAELNVDLAKYEAVRDKLAEEIDGLKVDVKELKEALENAKEMREEESEENAMSISWCRNGVEAVQQGIDILTKLYKTVEKAEISFVQTDSNRQPMIDAPETTFETGEAYKGAGGADGGAVGMLEVIQSDFNRELKKTVEAEAAAAKDYMQFKTETASSLGEKSVVLEQREKEHTTVLTSLDEAAEALDGKSEILIKAIQELIELQPACVDTGMSYEERVALREEEIEGLRKAGCILEEYAKYGPDGSGEDTC